MIRVRPIHYTPELDQWSALLEALGCVRAVDGDQWREFDCGSGTVALHRAAPGDEWAETSGLGFVVSNLDPVLHRLVAAGVAAAISHEGHGTAVAVQSASGLRFLVDADERVPTTDGELAVMPIWYQPDLAEVHDVFTALGLAPRIVAEREDWADYTADGGGLAARHRGAVPQVELAFEFAGDLEALGERLVPAGFPATIVDEAYNRTLRVSTPHGTDLWVNGAMSDLHGFQRVD